MRPLLLSHLFVTVMQFGLVGPALAGSTELSGPLAGAVTAATSAFKAQFTVDLKHYTVYIDQHKSEFEVVFVPDQLHKVDRKHPGIVGGETDYGPEAHYFVSRKTFKVIKYEFAR